MLTFPTFRQKCLNKSPLYYYRSAQIYNSAKSSCGPRQATFLAFGKKRPATCDLSQNIKCDLFPGKRSHFTFCGLSQVASRRALFTKGLYMSPVCPLYAPPMSPFQNNILPIYPPSPPIYIPYIFPTKPPS